MENYDYIRFIVCDINGASKGKLVPVRHSHDVIEKGTGLYPGVFIPVLGGALPKNTLIEGMNLLETGAPNVHIYPDLETLHAVPWANAGGKRTAQVLCSTRNMEDQSPFFVCPRALALKQIEKLSEMGYFAKSAYESELALFHEGQNDYAFKSRDHSSIRSAFEIEALIEKVFDQMMEAGVDIECFHTEFAPGQVEFNFYPQDGIQSPDNLFKFENALHEICIKEKFRPCFMSVWSQSDGGIHMSGKHFNVSLWDKNTKRNAFYDASQPRNLSKVGRHFIAGVLEHLDALTPLINPTTNCYRRLNSVLAAPNKKNWGMDNRLCGLRVKTYSESGSLIELRGPSGVSNPYLVFAATLAAGIDGIERQLEPPPENNEDPESVPLTLSAGLDALSKDNVLCTALGERFIEVFTIYKKETDVLPLSKSDVNNLEDKEGLMEELERYMNLP